MFSHRIALYFSHKRSWPHVHTFMHQPESYWFNTVQSHLWWWDPLKCTQLHVRAVTVALNSASQWLHCCWVKLFILKERISCMWKTWVYSPAQLCKLPWVACILSVSVFLFLTCDISSPKSSLRAIISFGGMWMWHVVKLIPSSVCSTSPWKINIPDMTSSFLFTAPAITGCRREAASRRCQMHLDSSCFLEVGFRRNVLFI